MRIYTMHVFLITASWKENEKLIGSRTQGLEFGVKMANFDSK